MNTAHGHNIDERVIGFDAREVLVPDWLEARRTQYLLRSDIGALSADEMVSPNVFSRSRTPGEPEQIGLHRPAWTGPISSLWDELGRLKACLNDAWGTTWQPCHLIAVTLLYGLASQDEKADWDNFIVGITPSVVAKDWGFLGYDVCDGSVLSGLMNCGYMPDQEDVQGLRDRWAPHLNDHHLFGDLQQATEFVTVSNRRVAEHAPFFVYGIYVIPQ